MYHLVHAGTVYVQVVFGKTARPETNDEEIKSTSLSVQVTLDE